MWISIIVPSIPPLWPLVRRTYVRTSTIAYNVRGSKRQTLQESPASPATVTNLRSPKNTYHTSALGEPRSRFYQLGSRTSIDEASIPRYGIMMTREISVEPENVGLQRLDLEAIQTERRPS